MKLKYWSVAVIALLLSARPATAGFGHAGWSHHGDVVLPPGASSGFQRLQLPPIVQGRAAFDLRDLRLVDDTGAETPYALELPKLVNGNKAIQTERVFNLSEKKRVISFTADLGPGDIMHQAVQIKASTDAAFNCPVSVEGSDDGREWAVLRKDGRIFHYPAEGAAWKTVYYPPSNHRFVRVKIDNRGTEPLPKLDHDPASFLGAEPEAEELRPLPQKSFKVINVPRDRLTKVRVDLGYRQLFPDQVRLRIKDGLFFRRVEILGSDDNVIWRWAGESVIFRYQARRSLPEQTEIEVPFGTSCRYLLLQIRNGNDRPLDISGVEVLYRQPSLVFKADPGRSYRLYFGNPAAAAPQYDLQRLYPALALSEDFHPARLGNIRGREPSVPSPPWTESRRWLLTAALALTVAVLGWVTLRAIQS